MTVGVRPVRAPARPRRPSTVQFVVSGIWASLNLIGGLFSLPFAFWMAACPSDGDTSGCAGAASGLIFSPSILAALGFVLWCVGVRRRLMSDGIAWAWCGVAVGCVGGLLLVVATLG